MSLYQRPRISQVSHYNKIMRQDTNKDGLNNNRSKWLMWVPCYTSNTWMSLCTTLRWAENNHSSHLLIWLTFINDVHTKYILREGYPFKPSTTSYIYFCILTFKQHFSVKYFSFCIRLKIIRKQFNAIWTQPLVV